MLVRKKKEKLFKKHEANETAVPEENLQSLRSWVRKIEQTTTSVSSRLSAVEKRLSGRMNDSDTHSSLGLEGPIETLLLHGKKKNAPDIARVLDSELALLHNELVKQQQETSCLKQQCGEIEKISTTIITDFQTMQTAIADLNTTVDLQMNQTERNEPFMMHLGSLEVPVEFTGIIGGLLAFTVAILVLINQKEILLSPWFLIPVGLLLIGFAFLKMFRNRSRTPLQSFISMPLKNPSAPLGLVACETKEG